MLYRREEIEDKLELDFGDTPDKLKEECVNVDFSSCFSI